MSGNDWTMIIQTLITMLPPLVHEITNMIVELRKQDHDDHK